MSSMRMEVNGRKGVKTLPFQLQKYQNTTCYCSRQQNQSSHNHPLHSIQGISSSIISIKSMDSSVALPFLRQLVMTMFSRYNELSQTINDHTQIITQVLCESGFKTNEEQQEGLAVLALAMKLFENDEEVSQFSKIIKL
jgi:hypothetical protein